MITRTPECHCLNCGKKMDSMADPPGEGGRGPAPGDMTVCLRCGAVMKIADDLTVRPFTEEEEREIYSDPAFVAYLEKLTLRVRMMPKKN